MREIKSPEEPREFSVHVLINKRFVNKHPKHGSIYSKEIYKVKPFAFAISWVDLDCSHDCRDHKVSELEERTKNEYCC
jgi:hypothetical protein